jgi:hypothetical protein
MGELKKASASGLGLIAVLALSWGCAQKDSGRTTQALDLAPGAQASEDGVVLGDDPSPLAVMLHWGHAVDGATPLTELRVEVENTVDRRMEVELYVVSEDADAKVELAPRKLSLSPKTSATESFSVSDLGVQVVGAAAPTLVYAKFIDFDQVPRVSALFPVWVSHEADFKTARVRSSEVEARRNTHKGIAGLHSGADVVRRVLEPTTGRVVETVGDSTGQAFGGRAALIHNPVDAPDPSDPDNRRFLGSSESSGLQQKAGNYTLCFRLPYLFLDAGFGEDRFTATTGTPRARYMFAALYNPSGGLEYFGQLNESGCTGSLAHSNGTWMASLTTSLHDYGSGATIQITDDSTGQFTWLSQTYSISGSGGLLDMTMSSVAVNPSVNVGLAAGASLFYVNYALGTETVYVYSQQNCDLGQFACYDPSINTVYYGPGSNGVSRTSYKSVVLHELGHAVADQLWGTLHNDYNSASSNVAQCKCDHITSSTASHCLQSKEMAWAAQGEGFGHFFAADTWNDSSEANCTFAYYKEFKESNGAETPPPMAKSCSDQVRWMESHCWQTSDRGTEFDWMGFYWQLNNKTSNKYSYSSLGAVYRRACDIVGGNPWCNGLALTSKVSWDALVAATIAEYGGMSAKAMYWAQTGDDYGVDH